MSLRCLPNHRCLQISGLTTIAASHVKSTTISCFDVKRDIAHIEFAHTIIDIMNGTLVYRCINMDLIF